ncbi:MAG: lycopene cyclase domain-containing protein [Candidatus Paceibacterota bacterium]|nr:MAG: lycopene cyclase domain-containing protein [Candidatus Paceibacterota bacterium]
MGIISKKFYYLLTLLFAFGIPAFIEGYLLIDRINVVNLVSFVFGILLLGSIWDIWATRHGRKDSGWLWQFNFNETLGIKFLGLPIEEYMFYIFASLYIVFTWEAINLAQHGNILMRVLVPTFGVWTLLAILIPIMKKSRNDKLSE